MIRLILDRVRNLVAGISKPLALLAVLTSLATVLPAFDAHAWLGADGRGGWDPNRRPPSHTNIPSARPRCAAPYDDQFQPHCPGAEPASPFFGQRVNTPGTGLARNNALQRMCEDGLLMERVVRCVTLVVNEAVTEFVSEFRTWLDGVIFAAIVLAMTIFGARVLQGTVDDPKSEAFMLAFKIAGVLVFTNLLGGFHTAIFPMMESFAGYGLSYLSSADTTLLSGCGARGGLSDSIGVWAKMDCILERLFLGGMAGGDVEVGGAGALWVLAMAVFWTNLFGILVFLIMINVFITLFLLILRCVYVFLACYCYLGLLIAISPMIIPCILFKFTMKYFDKWLRQFIGMIIQPMILFVFMCFFFAVLDNLFFGTPPAVEYSLANILGAGWETPGTDARMSEEDISRKMTEFEDQTGYNSGDDEWDGYETWLRNRYEYNSVGNVSIVHEKLFDITIELPDVPGEGVPFIGDVISAGADLAEMVANWGADRISDIIFPFKFPKVQPPDGQSRWNLLFNLLKFFLVISVLMPLMIKFARDIPLLMQNLASVRRTPGQVMPGERQLMGAVGAVKGATKGAVKGAVKGLLKGGKKGAIAGAAKGAKSGAVEGYQKGSSSVGDVGGGNSIQRLKSGGKSAGGAGAEQGSQGTGVMHQQHLGNWGGAGKAVDKATSGGKGGGGGGLDKLKGGGGGGGDKDGGAGGPLGGLGGKGGGDKGGGGGGIGGALGGLGGKGGGGGGGGLGGLGK